MSRARHDRGGLYDRASAHVALFPFAFFLGAAFTATLVASAMLYVLCLALFVNIHPLF